MSGSAFTRGLRGWLSLLAAALALAAGLPAAAQTGSAQQTLKKPPAGSRAPATRWETALRARTADLAIAPSGDVYALDASGILWRLPAEETKSGTLDNWIIERGRYRRIRATHDGSMWAIDARGMLYRLRGDVWYGVAPGVRDVAAAPDGRTLILSTGGGLFDFRTRRPFVPVPPASSSPADSLVADAHGLPWLQRRDGSVIRFDGTAWRNVARTSDRLASIAAGYDGSIFGIARDGRVRLYQFLTNAWTPYASASRRVPPLRHLAIQPNGLPWGIARSGHVIAERTVGAAPPRAVRTPAAFTRLLAWQNTGRASRRVGIGDDGTVYTIAPDGAVWRRSGKDWSRVLGIRGRMEELAVGTRGGAWVLDPKGAILRIQSGFVSPFPGGPPARLIAAGPRDTLWAVFGADRLLKWNSAARRWEAPTKLPQAPAAIAIGPRDELWIVDAKGIARSRVNQVWRPVEASRSGAWTSDRTARSTRPPPTRPSTGSTRASGAGNPPSARRCRSRSDRAACPGR